MEAKYRGCICKQEDLFALYLQNSISRIARDISNVFLYLKEGRTSSIYNNIYPLVLYSSLIGFLTVSYKLRGPLFLYGPIKLFADVRILRQKKVSLKADLF